VGTPVVGHGMVYVTGGYPPVRPIYAVRPGARGELEVEDGDAPGEHLAWANMSEGTYMPTPLLYGDLLYTLANNGVLRVFDARTGERLYRHRVAGRGGVAFTASPVAAGGRLYVASEEGKVYVVRAGRSFELLAENSVGEVVMATPAIAGDLLFVRSLSKLYAFGEDPSAGEPSR
ncbi:MAG: PQQ-binding-like beta-propeller repeat protein, partial [Holophagales bacterium]|nr:PQQ-binding-like beta-propeller repeat protein [Holophagales bacterium]